MYLINNRKRHSIYFSKKTFQEKMRQLYLMIVLSGIHKQVWAKLLCAKSCYQKNGLCECCCCCCVLLPPGTHSVEYRVPQTNDPFLWLGRICPFLPFFAWRIRSLWSKVGSFGCKDILFGKEAPSSFFPAAVALRCRNGLTEKVISRVFGLRGQAAGRAAL